MNHAYSSLALAVVINYSTRVANYAPRACIIKLITTVIYGFRNKLVFVPGKPFQSSLEIRDKHFSLLWKP
jgi:hypothetical protein